MSRVSCVRGQIRVATVVHRGMDIRIDDDAVALIESKGGVVALDFISPVG